MSQFALTFYKAATNFLRPIAPLILKYRLSKGKEHPTRMNERRGFAGIERPHGALIWLHAASIGEFMSILPLIERIVVRELTVLVTTGTLTSASVAAQRLPKGAIHQFIPLDIKAYMSQFLDFWKPDLALLTESEIWPNLMQETANKSIPLGIINGRMSERSYKRWKKIPRSMSALLSKVDFCLAQSKCDANRFMELGAKNVQNTGNLKFDCEVLPVNNNSLEQLQHAIQERPLWLAASTHEGEEEIIFKSHIELKRQHQNLLTLIVPRHPARGAKLAAQAKALGLDVALRSNGDEPHAATDIYIADTLGELGLFYSISPIVFMGASLVSPGGGHNPIEAAQLNCALLHGAYVNNFSDLYARLDAEKGSIKVHSEHDIAFAVDQFLQNTSVTQSTAHAAKTTIDQLGGAATRMMHVLEPFLLKMEQKL
jgi:3-deoxy-D-manno-octulosonic-acid transferase